MKRYVGYYVYHCDHEGCDEEAPTCLRPRDTEIPPGWHRDGDVITCPNKRHRDSTEAAPTQLQ
jgi:hypothetical protein